MADAEYVIAEKPYRQQVRRHEKRERGNRLNPAKKLLFYLTRTSTFCSQHVLMLLACPVSGPAHDSEWLYILKSPG